jgi:hypothetical protein
MPRPRDARVHRAVFVLLALGVALGSFAGIVSGGRRAVQKKIDVDSPITVPVSPAE